MTPSTQAMNGDPRHSAVAPAEHRADAIWLGLILLIGVVLRVREATRVPMWFDEIYTWWASRGGASETLAVAVQDVHPPLQLLLLGAWGALGDAPLWLRSQSILFGIAALVVTFLMTRDMFGRGAAFLATAALAIHPVHVYFSQEVRSYALLWLLLPGTWWFAWRWVRHGRRRDAILYVVCAALALYTHYFAGIVLAFSAGWGVLALITQPRRLAHWFGWNALVAVMFAPQLPTLVQQMSRLGESHWIKPQSLQALLDWLRHMAYSAMYLVPLFALAGVLPFFRPRQRHAAGMLLVVAALPPLVCWWLTARGAHLYTERYMFYALPAAMALAAAGIAGLPHAVLRWGVAVVVLLFGARSLALHPPHSEGAWLQDAMAYVETQALPGDFVFVADTHSLLFMQHNAPQLARYRLVWPEPSIPYFEGAAVIPDSLPVDPATFEAHDGRWWGIHTHHGGQHGAAAAQAFRRRAGDTERKFGRVTVWGPHSGP